MSQETEQVAGPVVSTERVDLIFTYRVKNGMEERFEDYLAAVPRITEADEPYVLEYELFRRRDGSFLQHERYENETAIWKHLEVTADGQTAWGEATELLSLTVIGELSDRYWEQFDGWDGPDPVSYARFREVVR